MLLCVISYFFILDLSKFELMRGKYLKLKASFLSKTSCLPEFILNYISFKAKSESHMNIREVLNIANEKLMDQF